MSLNKNLCLMEGYYLSGEISSRVASIRQEINESILRLEKVRRKLENSLGKNEDTNKYKVA